MTWECPICGHENDDERDMCEDCGTPRPAGVAPAAAAPKQASARVPVPESQSVPVVEPSCPVPAQPVAMPAPSPVPQPVPSASAEMTVPTLTLVDPVMGEQLRLTGAAVLGRNVFPNMASNFAMSRKHASVHFEQGTWMLADEGSNNGTALMRSGQILNLVPGVAQPIHTGDVLLIPAVAGGYAQLRLAVTVEESPATQYAQSQAAVAPPQTVGSQPAEQTVSAPAPAAPTADPAAAVEGWFVECPECGRLHLVADERAKVTDGCDECGCSLARTSAVYRTLGPGEDYTDVR